MAHSLLFLVRDDGDYAWRNYLPREFRSYRGPSRQHDVVAIRWYRHDGSFVDIAREGYKELGSYTLPQADFIAFKRGARQANTNTGMVNWVQLIEQYFPKLHFVPEHFRSIILDTAQKYPLGEYRELFALLYWQNDLSDFAALLLGPKKQTLEFSQNVPVDRWRHLKKKWFAFRDINDALLVKLKFNGCKVFATRDDI